MSTPAAEAVLPLSRPAGQWRVHKFGGSSVADATCFRRVADILEADPEPRLGVVLSACKGVTDSLLGLVALAEARDPAVAEKLAAVQHKHVGIATELLGAAERDAFVAQLAEDCRDLAGLLQAVALLRRAGQDIRDLVSG